MILAIFLHDYGKKFAIKTFDDGSTSCKGHETVSSLKIKEHGILERFELSIKEKYWIYHFIENHAEIHICLDSIEKSKEKLKLFREKFYDSYLENLIFGISDIKDSFFKKHNPDEYNRRIKILTKCIDKEINNK